MGLSVAGLCLPLYLYLREQHQQELAQQHASEAAERQALRDAQDRAARDAEAAESEKRAQRESLLLRAQLDPSVRGYLRDMGQIQDEYDRLAPKDQLEADQLLMQKWGLDQATVSAAKTLRRAEVDVRARIAGPALSD